MFGICKRTMREGIEVENDCKVRFVDKGHALMYMAELFNCECLTTYDNVYYSENDITAFDVEKGTVCYYFYNDDNFVAENFPWTIYEKKYIVDEENVLKDIGAYFVNKNDAYVFARRLAFNSFRPKYSTIETTNYIISLFYFNSLYCKWYLCNSQD